MPQKQNQSNRKIAYVATDFFNSNNRKASASTVSASHAGHGGNHDSAIAAAVSDCPAEGQPATDLPQFSSHTFYQASCHPQAGAMTPAQRAALFEAVHQAHEKHRLEPGEYLLLNELCHLTIKLGRGLDEIGLTLRASIRKFQELTGLSRNTARRIALKLHKAGLLVRETVGGGDGLETSTYTLRFAWHLIPVTFRDALTAAAGGGSNLAPVPGSHSHPVPGANFDPGADRGQILTPEVLPPIQRVSADRPSGEKLARARSEFERVSTLHTYFDSKAPEAKEKPPEREKPKTQNQETQNQTPRTAAEWRAACDPAELRNLEQHLEHTWRTREPALRPLGPRGDLVAAQMLVEARGYDPDWGLARVKTICDAAWKLRYFELTGKAKPLTEPLEKWGYLRECLRREMRLDDEARRKKPPASEIGEKRRQPVAVGQRGGGGWENSAQGARGGAKRVLCEAEDRDPTDYLAEARAAHWPTTRVR